LLFMHSIKKLDRNRFTRYSLEESGFARMLYAGVQTKARVQR
jgi:hypothetical protein